MKELVILSALVGQYRLEAHFPPRLHLKSGNSFLDLQVMMAKV